ncbi:hypothetical protein [Nostoc sp. ChiQUE01b]|nr:hypothetical protein [Nostoc sp. ChiQUE01b]
MCVLCDGVLARHRRSPLFSYITSMRSPNSYFNQVEKLPESLNKLW